MRCRSIEIGRLGALFRLRSSGTPNTGVADYWDSVIPWVSAKDMKSLRIVDTEDYIKLTCVRFGARIYF